MDLGVVGDCNINYTLNYNYYSDHDGSDPDPHKDVWDFTSGNSAGVCKDDNLFYIADTSDLHQPFDDGFVKFNVSADGVEGSNVVPYLPQEFFDGFEVDGSCPYAKQKEGYSFYPWFRFSNIWFQNKNKYNYLQILGAGNICQLDDCTVCSGTWPMPQISGITGLGYGGANNMSNRISLIFRGAHEFPCYTDTEKDNYTRSVVDHEVGHQFYVNPTLAGGHDPYCEWAVTGEGCFPLEPCSGSSDFYCLMNPDRNRLDSRNRFDYEDLICGKSGCPNGTEGCCSGCFMPGNGSIRQLYDPLRGIQQ